MVGMLGRQVRDEFADRPPIVESPERGPALRLAIDELAGAESPARRLQQDLERSWRAAEAPRWSARRTVAFAVATNGLFWLATVWALKTIF